jgi:hypothetical protein
VNLETLAAQPTDVSFDEWWRKVESAVGDEMRKGVNSLIILGTWTIWKHRNDCVFNSATPNIAMANMWGMAGAKGISLLSARGMS